MFYDLIIIGGGPGGVAASVYAVYPVELPRKSLFSHQKNV